jgi:hypothetical protein
MAAFMIFAAVSDLYADATYGIPVDHDATFTALAGARREQARAVDPATASYVTLLERGYAIHELTFAALFIVLLAIPFRRRQRWAWWTCWLLMIANLGYTATFGAHEPDHARPQPGRRHRPARRSPRPHPGLLQPNSRHARLARN